MSVFCSCGNGPHTSHNSAPLHVKQLLCLVSLGSLLLFSDKEKETVSPKVRMHLSMDTLGIVDDSCLDNYDMVKGAGSSAGGRVHSIDVILGFTKDQDPLLHSAEGDDGQKANGANSQNLEKTIPSDPYAHLPDLGDSSQNSSYHGESFHKRHKNGEIFFLSLNRSGDFLVNQLKSGIKLALRLLRSCPSNIILTHMYLYQCQVSRFSEATRLNTII